MGYSNGQIPADALVAISGRAGARLLAGPAASWERVLAEVQRRYGWSPTPTGPDDAYRSLAVQVATFLDRYVPARTGGGVYGDVRWWNGVRYVRKPGSSAAAVPGTSNHGKGRAVDVTGLGGFAGVRYGQFASVAVPLGWSNAEGRSVDEPWHWVDLLSPELVSSGHATVPGISTPQGPTSALTPPEEADMPLSQSDLEAIDRIVAGQLDARLRIRDASKVPADQVGVVVSQGGREELDRVIAGRLDSRAARPLLIRDQGTGQIVADVGTGYRPLDDLSLWQTMQGLGYSVRLDLPSADFARVVTALGGMQP